MNEHRVCESLNKANFLKKIRLDILGEFFELCYFIFYGFPRVFGTHKDLLKENSVIVTLEHSVIYKFTELIDTNKIVIKVVFID